MDLWSMATLLGLPADGTEIRQLLGQLGVSDPPELPEGDAKAYVEAKRAGLYLVFTDESFFRKVDDPPIGSGPLLLTNVTAYCRPLGEYAAYDGTLPFGILQSDAPDLVRSKMSEPDSFNERASLERWTVDGVWVFVKYDRAMTSIDRLTLQAPDA